MLCQTFTSSLLERRMVHQFFGYTSRALVKDTRSLCDLASPTPPLTAAVIFFTLLVPTLLLACWSSIPATAAPIMRTPVVVLFTSMFLRFAKALFVSVGVVPEVSQVSPRLQDFNRL